MFFANRDYEFTRFIDSRIVLFNYEIIRNVNLYYTWFSKNNTADSEVLAFFLHCPNFKWTEEVV
jgi:hypothetical protein